MIVSSFFCSVEIRNHVGQAVIIFILFNQAATSCRLVTAIACVCNYNIVMCVYSLPRLELTILTCNKAELSN